MAGNDGYGGHFFDAASQVREGAAGNFADDLRHPCFVPADVHADGIDPDPDELLRIGLQLFASEPSGHELVAVDAHDEREIAAGGRLDFRHHLQPEAHAVLERAAVPVGSPVGDLG